MTVETFLAGRVTLHRGDCLDVLDAMDENSVDSVVCDPPYHLTSIVKRFGGDAPPREAEGWTMSFRKETLAEGVEVYLGDARECLQFGPWDAPPYGIGEAGENFASRSKLANADKYKRSDWDAAPADQALIDTIRSVSRWQIIFGGNYFTLPPASCWLVWDKQNGDNDFADCELAWTNLPKAVRRIQWRWAGIWGSASPALRSTPAISTFACRRIAAATREPDLFVAASKPIEQTSMFSDEAA